MVRAFRMLQAFGRFPCCRQQEGERPGCGGFQQAELRRIHARVAADLGQVAAHQREVMVLVGVADAADALQRVLVADMAAQRVAGIGGIGDDAARADDFRGLPYKAQLRVFRVQFEVFGHCRYDTCMQMLLEFLPLVAFLVAYKLFGGIYVATATLMVGMVLSLAVLWVRGRRLPAMFALSTVLVLAFGALTLILRDARFIQWKPSIFLWLLALAFLASVFVGREPLAQRMLQPALGETRLERSDWLKLNAAWVLYGLVMGAVNLFVAYHASEATWVNVKIYGLMGSMFLFIVAQLLWLQLTGKLKS